MRFLPAIDRDGDLLQSGALSHSRRRASIAIKMLTRKW